MSTAGEDSSSLIVSPSTTVSVSLRRVFDEAWRHTAGLRGGTALLATIAGDDDGDVLDHLVARDCLWIARAGDAVRGFAVVRGRVIEGLWVNPPERRRGTARAILTTLGSLPEAPLDAWALPGDRATKSLYENVGWRARLLTMRGA
ncbi:MAG: GNAT family N-acetyltransferase [Acidimicrobiales bacterium]